MKTLTLNKEPLRDDLEVWRAFKGGDALAYSRLYERYVVVLYQYAYKIAGNADATKDCVQDLFIELWKNKSALGEPESVRNYLLKSIRRKAIRASNRRKRQVVSNEMAEHYCDCRYLDSRQSEIIVDETVRLRRRLLQNAISELSLRQQEAVFLKFFSKLGYHEMSSVMSISVEAVYNLISHAVHNLKTKIRREQVL